MVLGTAESKEAVHEVVGKKWCFGRSVGMARMSSDSRRDVSLPSLRAIERRDGDGGCRFCRNLCKRR